MTFDFPYLIATAALIVLVAIPFGFFGALKDMRRWRRILLHMTSIFVALLILNLVWPLSSAVSSMEL